MKITRRFGLSAVAAVVIALSVGFYSHAQDGPITSTQLPADAQAFIKKIFPTVTLATAEAEKEPTGTEYKVHLSNGVEIEFDNKGQWQEIDGNTVALPASVIPTTIKAYLDMNYKGIQLTQIGKERWGYNTELSNGLELDFDNTGKFLKIDN